MSLDTALDQLALAADACALAAESEASTVSDAALVAEHERLEASIRRAQVASAIMTAQIAYRSRPELGYDGLAQRLGARTPEKLVQRITGTSLPTARRLVKVGILLAEATAHDADPAVPVRQPWLAAALRELAAGSLTAEAVEVIAAGLGVPAEGVTVDALTVAAATLTELASSLTLELLAARAREARDELDFAGVAEREELRREQRYLTLSPQRDGMTRISGLLDPESAAVIKNAVDAAVSPAAGGPRFVSTDGRARAEALERDPRSREQLAVDALVELVDIAVRDRDNSLLGGRRADVRVLVSEGDLARRAGVGFIEGQSASVSIATVERHACDGGFVPIVFSPEGQSLNLGRSERFHTARQRIAIATRDGGCLAPDCDRPPSWCEVHHITEYSRGGDTSVEDGVLLCRHHHLMVHNNGWRITRTGDQYWLVPPPAVAPKQELIPLMSKSPALRRLLAPV